jgi:hypothetical protein
MTAKGWIAGIVVVAVAAAAVGWGLTQRSERLAAEAAAAERVAVAEAKERLTEMKRRALAQRAYTEEKGRLEMEKRREQTEREMRAQSAAWREEPRQRGAAYFKEGNWKKLDELVDSLAASGQRSPDGGWELQSVASGIGGIFNYHPDISDEGLQEKLASYQRDRPESAFAPILPAMYLSSAAWRARGSGYSSSVTDEGWKLFHQRSTQALKVILAARSRSERLPLWYVEAISTGLDANIEDEHLTALLEEGVKRFPDYYPIYKAYVRQLAPRWGGTYAGADAFVRAQVADRPNPEADVLYSYLYQKIDYFDGSAVDFFEKSLVSWSRFRAGFEASLQKYPDKLNKANFVAYACRARDGSAYMKFRNGVTSEDFMEVAPQGITLEVCDARFLIAT